MNYLSPNGIKYSWSYKELRDRYNEVLDWGDDNFMNRLPEILHLACIICFIKETPVEHSLGDEGVVHQIAHLIHIPEEYPDISLVRETFKIVCELV